MIFKIIKTIAFLMITWLTMMPCITHARPGDPDRGFNAPNGFVNFGGGQFGVALSIQPTAKEMLPWHGSSYSL